MKSTSFLAWLGSGACVLSATLALAQTLPSEPPTTMPIPPDVSAPAAATESPATQPADAVTPPAAAANQPANAPVAPEEQAARNALGERFVALAKFTMSQPAIVPSLIHQNAALVEAAARENPKELRFLRLVIESRLRNADSEAGRAALRDALLQYLNVLSGERQTDVVATIRLIDLNERDLQSAQKRVDYLQTIIGADGVGAEVKSHSSVLLARVYAERGQDTDADTAIDDALKLNPLNMEALRAKFERRGARATDAERLAMMLSILRSNPAQPDVMAQIARELADNGVLDQALAWYQSSFGLSGRLGRGLNLPDFIDYAATLLIAGQTRDAYGAAEKILQSDPGNGDAALIKLAAQRRLMPTDQLAGADDAATSMLLKRLDDLHAAVAQAQPPATTQPIEVVNEYVVADAQKIKSGAVDANIGSQYVGALARLAWFQIYYRQAPDSAAKSIEALRTLLPQDETVVTRLEGWSFLRKGDTETARNKLSAVAERDPLSKLGMLLIAEKDAGKVVRAPQAAEQIDPAKPGEVEASPVNDQLLQLAGTNAAGITGVVLSDELLGRGLKFTPGANAPAIRAEVEKFPKEFMAIIDRPDRFYKLTAEPLSVSHAFGQPVLATVTIQNISDFDLTMGDDGTIRPDLWFDAKLIGLVQQVVPAIAYDRMSQQVVLKAKTGFVKQTVRLDDGALGQMMMSQPIIALPMQFSVFTNPVPVAGAAAAPGPCGYRVQFTRVMERAGTPVSNQQAIQALMAPLGAGVPEQRMRTVDHLVTLIRAFSDPKATPESKQAAAQLYDALIRASAMHDPSPAAHMWLQYNLALVSSDADRERIMVTLLRSTDWDSRILGLRLLQAFPPERQKALASKFAQSDPDALVRTYAASVVETSELPIPRPATQPTDASQQPSDPNAPPTSPPP